MPSCCTNCSTSSVPPASNYFTLNSIFLFSEVSKKETNKQKESPGLKGGHQMEKNSMVPRGCSTQGAAARRNGFSPSRCPFLPAGHGTSPRLSSCRCAPRTPPVWDLLGAEDTAPGKGSLGCPRKPHPGQGLPAQGSPCPSTAGGPSTSELLARGSSRSLAPPWAPRYLLENVPHSCVVPLWGTSVV